MDDYARHLAGLLQSRPAVVIQNRLMSAADRDVALSMLYLEEHDRRCILQSISASKQRRVTEELELHEHLRILRAQYEAAIRSVIEALERDQPQSKLSSYIRPARGPRRMKASR
ncbi:MAG: hypothetical protein ACLFUM_08750 [Spirochaetaceae bacterium]